MPSKKAKFIEFLKSETDIEKFPGIKPVKSLDKIKVGADLIILGGSDISDFFPKNKFGYLESIGKHHIDNQDFDGDYFKVYEETETVEYHNIYNCLSTTLYEYIKRYIIIRHVPMYMFRGILNKFLLTSAKSDADFFLPEELVKKNRVFQSRIKE